MYEASPPTSDEKACAILADVTRRFLHSRATLSTLLIAGGLAVVVLVGHSRVSAQAAPLRLVSTEWPPFTNPPGQPRFALDLVEEAFKRINVAGSTSIVAPASYTQALLSNTFDGSAAAWRDPEREKALLFSQPYLENRLVLVARKGGDVTPAALSALRGKRIAIVEGYAYGDIDTLGPTFVRVPTDEGSLTELLRGNVDYTLMDALVVEYLESAHPDESQGRLAIGTNVMLSRPLYLAIRRSHPDAESIISRFNAQLRTMIVDRTYHRLLHVEWISSDIDGDNVPEYIPATDKAGPAPPQRIYSLFSGGDATKDALKIIKVNPHFYVGGTIYTDWATVPDPFKTFDTNQPDPARSTASIFKFTW